MRILDSQDLSRQTLRELQRKGFALLLYANSYLEPSSSFVHIVKQVPQLPELMYCMINA